MQLVNAVAPFILNARLKPLMLRTPERDKHIVNVSAVEGQFYRRFKTTRHPHTNMAKAALNMMTRTSAADYHADGIHMNSVDTGWVTDEDPAEIAARKTRRARLPPAARHRRRRRAHRRSDHRRLQHRRARLGPVPQGLPADGLVTDQALPNKEKRSNGFERKDPTVRSRFSVAPCSSFEVCSVNARPGRGRVRRLPTPGRCANDFWAYALPLPLLHLEVHTQQEACMSPVLTRTRRFLLVVWAVLPLLEVLVLLLAYRTNNSWFLLLAFGLLFIPFLATERTMKWFSGEPRKRWKRHDVAAGLITEEEALRGSAPAPPRQES